MSAADDLQSLADLCAAAAHQCLDEIVALGVKPTDAAPGLVWEQTRDHLEDQMGNLSAMATKLSSEAVLAVLDAAAGDLGDLADATQNAQQEIKQIQKISDFITRASQILDVGLAVLALASAPSVSAAQTLADKIKALATPLAG